MSGIDTKAVLVAHLNNNVLDAGLGPNCPHVITNHNVTFHDTIKVFGSHAGVFNGTDAYLSALDSDDYYFGTEDFTLELRVRFNDLTSYQKFFTQYNGAGDSWYVEKVEAASGNKLRLSFVSGSVTKAYIEMTNAWAGCAVDTWYHIVFERVGTGCKMFIDGVSQTLTESTAFGTNDVGNINKPLIIGYNAVAHHWIDGYVDEIRISKGIARWTENFDPPTKEYSVPAVAYPKARLNKNRISGYHCFMDAYMRAKREGLDPLKLPDGTVF